MSKASSSGGIELRRLRADLGVVVAIGRLRGSNIGKET